MARKRLLTQLYPPSLVIVLIALLMVTWYFTSEVRRFHTAQTTIDLKARAYLLEPQISGRFSLEQSSYLDALCKTLGKQSSFRITLILPDGTVLGDTAEDPAIMDNHSNRPEILAALRGREGVSVRYSNTVQETFVYVAVPVMKRNRLEGVIRASIPLTAIDSTLQGIYLRVGVVGFVIAILSAMVCLRVARRLSRPLEEMKKGAERFSSGELDRPLPVSGSEEVAGLAEALNQMAAQLDDRLQTVVQQRNEQDAVLTSMVEGVLAVDSEERVIRLNRAAGNLLGLSVEEVQGRSIQEVVRKVDLLRFVAETLEGRKATEGEILLRRDDGERFLQAHGTALRDSTGKDIGALVVLNDVTRLRRLENMRREFVGNVSHELKTPITAIKGSAETLLDGALEDPEGAKRFVGIIVKQSDRLNAIIDDLLALSRIEQGEDEGGVVLERGTLRPVLESAALTCSMAAEEKGIGLKVFCVPELASMINAPLLEQAVVNLITNAIKYSDRGGEVLLDSVRIDGRVAIRVQDWGCGIEEEHLSRLFERFYRVDKARSRNHGGTGLGLAIVKHIVQTHEGEVDVRSTPGEGSVFTIFLPEA